MYNILIPVLNEESHISACLESVFDDISGNVNIVLVDNGSSDRSLECISDFQVCHSNLICLAEHRPGVVNALNTGLKHIQSGWIARMDADDIWLPGRHQFIQSIISDKGLPAKSIVSTGLQYRTPDHQQLDVPSSQLLYDEALCEWLFLFGNPLKHPTILYKAEQILSLGAYSNLFPHAEDYDLWIRALEEGFSFLKYPDETVLYTLPSQEETHAATLNGKRNLQLVGNDALMYRAFKNIGADFTFDEICLLRIIFDAPELSNVDPLANFELQLLLEKFDDLIAKYSRFYSEKYKRCIPEKSMEILKRDFQAKRKRLVDGFNKLYPKVG